MKTTHRIIVIASLLYAFTIARAQDKPATQPFYEEDVASSNPLRAQQAKELDGYILAQKKDNTRLHALFRPDYSSPHAFEKSA